MPSEAQAPTMLPIWQKKIRFIKKNAQFSHQVDYAKKYFTSLEAHATACFFQHKTNVEPLTYNSLLCVSDTAAAGA